MESNITKQLNASRRLILVLLGVIVGTLILHEGRAQDLDKSLLWEVSGNGIKTSYVYGTFHLLPQSDFKLKEKVTNAFDGADQVVMEMDMDNPNLQAELMQNAAMKDGRTLDQLMSKEDYEKLDTYLKENLGMGLAPMNRFKPFFIGSMLVPSMIEGTPASYELTFLQRALNNEQEILGFETPTFQAQVFDNISYESQVENLLEVINQPEETSALFSQMIELYKNEEVGNLYELLLAEMESEEERKFLLSDRNKDWIPKIGEFSKDKTTFYAVGAGHLGGESGVIKLLQKAGYEVKPVMN